MKTGRRGRGATFLLLAVLLVALGAARAEALQVTAFDVETSVPGGDATAAVQAGGHPDLTASIDLSTTTDANGVAMPEANLKDADIELPAGLVGNAAAMPACTGGDLWAATCPVDTQIGVVDVEFAFGVTMRTPLHNMDPGPHQPAQFGFNALGVPVRVDAGLREADHGLTARIRNLSLSLPLVGVRLTLWGVPADPAHDPDRIDPLTWATGVPSPAPRHPLLTYPTSCDRGAPVTRLRARSWQQLDTWLEQSVPVHAAGEPAQSPTGCEKLAFGATLDVLPDVRRSSVPAGLAVRVRLDQDDSPDGLATAPLRSAVVVLPPGVALSPGGARGLGTCAPAEIALGDASAPRCSDRARIGEVELETPLLREPLRGSIFLADSARPFDGGLGVYLHAAGAGVVVKLPGRIAVDAATSRLTATFDALPELPLESLVLRFDGGAGALLSLPVACGPATTVATLTPHGGGPAVTSTSSFDVSHDGAGAPCPPRGFAPGFTAGSSNPTAGRDAPFAVRITRSDSDQELSGFSVELPPGVLGRIADVPALCPPAVAAAGACDEGSRVGSVAIAAGAGTSPLQLAGRVHLTGPYRGAPFGLALVVPAVAGPLDLGTVVVRASIEVDPRDASMRVVADPLPTMLAGVPLQVRSVALTLDRPRFTTTPTNCAPTQVRAELRSTQAATALVGSRYAVGECAALRYEPRMALRVGSRGHTRRGAAPPLRLTLRAGTAEASSRLVRVVLPSTINARFAVINRACTPAALTAGTCATRIGTATVVTPVLRDPLRGPIYLVRDPARPLPDLVIRLEGQIGLELNGRLGVTAGRRISTTFEQLPDVPVSRIDLRLVGGRDGALGTNADLCQLRDAARRRAQLSFVAHSGKRVERDRGVHVVGCAKRSAPNRQN